MAIAQMRTVEGATAAAAKSVSSSKFNERKVTSRSNINNSVQLSFKPPAITTVLKNNYEQRIVEVCIWLESGLEFSDVSVCVSDDLKFLNYCIVMDSLMGNGWGLHRDMMPPHHRMSKKERSSHIRVHHWNTVINDLRNSDGGFPVFTANIELPEEVCSKTILRQSCKESTWGSKMLVLDLLIEDAKFPAHNPKRKFDLVDDASDSDEDEDDGDD